MIPFLLETFQRSIHFPLFFEVGVLLLSSVTWPFPVVVATGDGLVSGELHLADDLDERNGLTMMTISFVMSFFFLSLFCPLGTMCRLRWMQQSADRSVPRCAVHGNRCGLPERKVVECSSFTKHRNTLYNWPIETLNRVVVKLTASQTKRPIVFLWSDRLRFSTTTGVWRQQTLGLLIFGMGDSNASLHPDETLSLSPSSAIHVRPASRAQRYYYLLYTAHYHLFLFRL